jgi:hypothetical protein
MFLPVDVDSHPTRIPRPAGSAAERQFVPKFAMIESGGDEIYFDRNEIPKYHPHSNPLT